MARRSSNKPQPEVQLDSFPKLKGWVLDSMDKHADWYKEAEECFGFVAGRSMNGKGQWPGDSWQQMLDSGRQPIEFNRIGPIVDSVCGLEVNNRQAIKFLPRTQGDTEVNERLSSLCDWARDEADAEDEESDMFRNAVICGRGFTETRIDFDEEPTGKIVIDNLDPLEVGVDPASRKPCFSDARYFWRYRDIATDDAKAMFPGVDPSNLHAAWAMRITPQDGGQGNKTDYPEEQRPGFAPVLPPKQVRMVQIQWWERSSKYLVAGPDDVSPKEMPPEQWEPIADQATQQGYKAQKVETRRYYQAILGRASVIDQTELQCFTIRACTGRYDRNKSYHYGIVRPCRDPQMLANKTLAQVLHILNANAKGGIMFEAGAFRNPRDAEKDWSNPSKSIVLNDGALSGKRIQERTAPAMPQALPVLQEFSISSIRDVTGVSVEMLGLADRDQPASLEYQRRQSAMTILASLFNGLRHYRKLQGRTMLEQLKLLPPGVLVRVLIDPQQAMQMYAAQMMQWQQQAAIAQQQGQQPPPQPQPPGAEFLKSTKVGEVFDPNKFGLGPDARFDVIVDEMPSSPNQKEATWQAIQPFIPEMPLPLLPTVLKYSPLPETAVEDISQAIENMGGQGVDPSVVQKGQEVIQQLTQENQSLKLKNQQLSDRSQLDAAKTQAILQDSDTNRLRAISEAGQGAAQLNLDALGQKLDALTTLIGHMVTHQNNQQNAKIAEQAARQPGGD